MDTSLMAATLIILTAAFFLTGTETGFDAELPSFERPAAAPGFNGTVDATVTQASIKARDTRVEIEGSLNNVKADSVALNGFTGELVIGNTTRLQGKALNYSAGNAEITDPIEIDSRLNYSARFTGLKGDMRLEVGRATLKSPNQTLSTTEPVEVKGFSGEMRFRPENDLVLEGGFSEISTPSAVVRR